MRRSSTNMDAFPESCLSGAAAWIIHGLSRSAAGMGRRLMRDLAEASNKPLKLGWWVPQHTDSWMSRLHLDPFFFFGHPLSSPPPYFIFAVLLSLSTLVWIVMGMLMSEASPDGGWRTCLSRRGHGVDLALVQCFSEEKTVLKRVLSSLCAIPTWLLIPLFVIFCFLFFWCILVPSFPPSIHHSLPLLSSSCVCCDSELVSRWDPWISSFKMFFSPLSSSAATKPSPPLSLQHSICCPEPKKQRGIEKREQATPSVIMADPSLTLHVSGGMVERAHLSDRNTSPRPPTPKPLFLPLIWFISPPSSFVFYPPFSAVFSICMSLPRARR